MPRISAHWMLVCRFLRAAPHDDLAADLVPQRRDHKRSRGRRGLRDVDRLTRARPFDRARDRIAVACERVQQPVPEVFQSTLQTGSGRVALDPACY